MTAPTKVDHPAKFSAPIVAELRAALAHWAPVTPLFPSSVLDPFAGVGGVHDLAAAGYDTTGLELEADWAATHPRTICGNATAMPFEDGSFDIIVTSPCMEVSETVLTADLRWVAVGDVRVGDQLMAFDEHPGAASHGGRAARRRWQRTTVVRSVRRAVECVRVVLANGDEVVTTPEHPWLTKTEHTPHRWTASRDLISSGRSVLLQVRPWAERRSFEAGWLSGMFDGEGSLSMGAHGAPKLTMYQVDSPVLDRAERLMIEFGYSTNRIPRRESAARKPVHNLYVTGGFPGIMRALGELRPVRLLEKWEHLDLSSRTVEAESVAVVAVEPCGMRQIQEIETSHGTYIGRGYLMHNCYGNRMADTYDGSRDRCTTCKGDGEALVDDEIVECPGCGGSGLMRSKRYTYRIALGHDLTDGSAAGLQWGHDYRELHRAVWREANRVLKPRGLLMLNISDHIRNGDPQGVDIWHASVLGELGFRLLEQRPIRTQRSKNGANRDARALCEWLLVFRRRAAA